MTNPAIEAVRRELQMHRPALATKRCFGMRHHSEGFKIRWGSHEEVSEAPQR